MKRFVLMLLLVVMLFVAGGEAGYLFRASSVEAAPAVKSQEAGCALIAMVGAVEVDDCITESGFKFVANSAGMVVGQDQK